MANYRNYLRNKNGIPILGAQACLYDSNGNKIDVDITEEDGLYYFNNLKTGHYQIRFFGRDLTEDDWLEIDIVDELPTFSGISFDPIIFINYPNLIVTEGDAFVTKQGEITQVNYALTSLETSKGKISSVSIYVKKEDNPQWTLLDNLNIDSNSLVTDQYITTITGVAELELINKPTLFHFKAEFFNQVGDIATLNEQVVGPTTSLLCYGITDLNEYVGVTNLVTINTVPAPNKHYFTIPTDELICIWDDMKLSNSTNFFNALGQPITVTKTQLRNISGYSIFMFISKHGFPPTYPWPYPSNDNYGSWYFVNTVPINRAIIRIPKNKFVKIWVGFKTEKTDSTTNLTKLEYKY